VEENIGGGNQKSQPFGSFGTMQTCQNWEPRAPKEFPEGNAKKRELRSVRLTTGGGNEEKRGLGLCKRVKKAKKGDLRDMFDRRTLRSKKVNRPSRKGKGGRGEKRESKDPYGPKGRKKNAPVLV